MRLPYRLLHLATTVATAALLWDGVGAIAAVAQQPPLPLVLGQPTFDPSDPNQMDPPVRVGRIADTTGTLSFHNRGDTQWSPVNINYPVSSGNSFWAEPSATAALEVSASRIVLAGDSEFDVAALDANGLRGVAAQGETYFRMRDLAPGETWTVQTPRGLVRFGGAGRYDIIAGTTEQPTMITVLEGAATIEGAGLSLQLSGGQTGTVSGTDAFQGNVGPAQFSPFLTQRLNAERPRPTAALIPTQVEAQVANMPGGDALYGVGTWNEAPQYGQVWYPPVSPGWVPYREGNWAYVAPWGWTWIDNAPWGFAPFHYGRWIEIGNRWAWTPGAVLAGPPAYAPALVTFIGIGAGAALGGTLTSGSIGWIPLGPYEPFRPWYHASPAYLREVNGNYINNFTINTLVNRGAATAIPVTAMTDSRPMRGLARPVSPAEFASARPIVGQQPVRPTAATAGVTPLIARQLNLAPAAGMRSAPGPAIRPSGARGAGFAGPIAIPTPNAMQPNRPAVITPESARPPQPAVARPPPVLPPSPAELPQVTTPYSPEPQPIRPISPIQANSRPGVPQVITPHPAEPAKPRPSDAQRSQRPGAQPTQPFRAGPRPQAGVPRPAAIRRAVPQAPHPVQEPAHERSPG